MQSQKEMWNKRYLKDEYHYGKEPNAFLKDNISLIRKGGRVLFPFEGEGRNAVYVAEKGFSVYAFDISEKAREKAIKLSDERGVKIDYIVSSVEDYCSDESFDAVVMIYAHLDESVREKIHRKISSLLNIGGFILLEAFSKDQLGRESGGPKNSSMLYTKEMIASDFSCLETLHLSEEEVYLSEGKGHLGKASVIRYIGKKVI